MTLAAERKKARKKISPVQPASAASAPAFWEDTDDLRWAVRRWATRIGVTVKSVHIRAMRSKWASISMAGRLTLNSELLELPRDLGEFVVVHELVHLLNPEARHGRVFKVYMSAYLPDWKERAARLSIHIIR